MNDFKELGSDLQKIAKKENIDISKVRLWNNEGSNILKVLTKINQSIPKWTWNKTETSKQLYQIKYDIIEYLILKISNQIIKWNYRWWIDVHLMMPIIKIEIWNIEKAYHIPLEIRERIKSRM